MAFTVVPADFEPDDPDVLGFFGDPTASVPSVAYSVPVFDVTVASAAECAWRVALAAAAAAAAIAAINAALAACAGGEVVPVLGQFTCAAATAWASLQLAAYYQAGKDMMVACGY
jgi:hypothetical protein